MEFRILGPLEVIEDGQALDLGGQKQRALLAVLLLHANEVVSADRLIDALWPERPPETAAKALQVYVSQLRKTLGKKRVETRTPGYLLRIGEDELDLERCRRLAEAGKPGEALSLWRGSSLTDFAYEPFAQVEIGRLEALRLACLEDRLDLDLVAGSHASVVGELESLVAQHPLRERFRAQLMLALYRSGRQAEALDVYQAGHRLLADELGLEPGDALRSMQKAIHTARRGAHRRGHAAARERRSSGRVRARRVAGGGGPEGSRRAGEPLRHADGGPGPRATTPP